MLKIAVCDDEKLYCENIKGIICEYCTKKNIEFEVELFESGDDFVALENSINQFNIVYLDVNMNGLDGIRTAEIIRYWSQNIFIVFITAFINYTLEGYKVEAIRYILKNGDIRENIYESLDAVLEKTQLANHIYEFKFKEGIRKLSPEQIILIESKLHILYFRVLIKSEIKYYTMSAKLNDIQKKLTKENVFVRIHQSYFVNLKYIKDISNYQAKLWDNDILPISRPRYRDVKESFLLYEGEF
nr:LytTR family DNA-binding domain-containing protein [uncultured Anaerostipes sp.]